MTDRRAYVMVSDDLLVGITGKLFLHGIYSTDISIPGPEMPVGQLVFYFSIETPIEHPFEKLSLRVTLPDTPPATADIQLPPPLSNDDPRRKKFFLRFPFALQQIVLRPGKVETFVITESEEIDAGGIWIRAPLAIPT